MILTNNKFRIHTFDIETSNAEFKYVRGNYSLGEYLKASRAGAFDQHEYFNVHARSQILQLWGEGLTQDEGWIHPGSVAGYTNRAGGRTAYHVSKFSRGIYSEAMQFGKVGEEQAIDQFFRGLNSSILEANRPVAISGWNMVYDLSGLEAATYRYESLAKWRGFIATMADANKLHINQAENTLFNAVWEYGARNRKFAERYLYKTKSAADIRSLPGWGVENVARAAGGAERFAPGFKAHRAQWDTRLTSEVASRLAHAEELRTAGLEFEQSFLQSGFLAEGQSFEQFATTLLRDVPEGAASAVAGKSPMPVGKFLAGAAVIGAAIVATQIAFSKRGDRQTMITGLSDAGVGAEGRHERTDFGSGYKGIANDDQQYSPTMRAAVLLTGGYGINATHRYALRNVAGYGTDVYKFVRGAEERFPMQMLNTLRLGELMSSYVAPDFVRFKYSDLVQGSKLTALGSTFERMGQGRIDVLNARKGLTLNRVAGTAYHAVEGANDVKIRLAAGGHIAGSAMRYGAELHDNTRLRGFNESWWQHHRRTQDPGRILGGFKHVLDNEEMFFQPYMAEVGTEAEGWEGAWNRGKSLYNKIGTLAFEFAERPQHLLAQMGLGLKQGSYNKVFHVPFVGEGGLVNELLKKRVVPAYLGYLGLKWLDYQLDHKPSEYIAGLPLKARVAHAELTDRTPGARSVTDWYANVVPGPQYGPLALPAGGAFLGGVYHWAQILRGTPRKALPTIGSEYKWARSLPQAIRNTPTSVAIGAALGAALMLPFVPGMLGDRKTAEERRRIYSGEQLVPVRQGRWWEMGSTPWEGNRIQYYKPHWYALKKARAEDASLYGDEKEYWGHHPLLHPIKYLRDPYWLEEKHYEDRPYPVTSPWGADIPLIGPVVAATIGKLIKPVKYMHTDEWKQGDDYALYGQRMEPKDKLRGVAPPVPNEEFSSFGRIAGQETNLFADFIGMPGFIMSSLYQNYFPDQDKGREIFLQGSRQMTSASRRYYERELGALAGPNPGGDEIEPYGYSEAYRRFVQREKGLKQANPLTNKMPSWIPGADYMVDFHKGDPYASLPFGYTRLPGGGYAALHPEVAGVNPDDYPLWNRFEILADVAPYSKQFSKYRDIVRGEAKRDTALRIKFETVMERVRHQKESNTRFTQRRFTAETDTIKGTVEKVSNHGFELKEFPGRQFAFSSLGLSAADLSAVALGENNRLTTDQVAGEVDQRTKRRYEFLQQAMGRETSVEVTVQKGAAEHDTQARAVVKADGKNINRALIKEGLALERPDLGGAESRAMYGALGRAMGAYAEDISFSGDEDALNPLRYLPTPYHTKLWQERTPISQYEQQEVYGTRMRRWHRPIHDFLAPYARGLVRRVTGERAVPEDVQFRRDLNSLTDVLDYLQGVTHGYTNQARRTSVGANLFSAPEALTRTLSDHEPAYFRQFVQETDPKKRKHILEVVSPEMARALSAQWVSKDAAIAKAEGKKVPTIGEGGRLFTKEGLDEYEHAKTQLDYGDYQRSKEIAEFFKRSGFRLPDEDSASLDDALDFDDVKLKIIQNEGYDAHDFNVFDDRAATLWRKPYVDGAARELTSGDDRTVEQLRQAVERMMVSGRDKNPRVKVAAHPSHRSRANVKVTLDIDQQDEILDDARRNRERYEEE